MKRIENFLAVFFLSVAFACAVLGLIITLSSCSTVRTKREVQVDTILIPTIVRDTVVVDYREEVENLTKRLEIAQDSVKYYRDSVEYKNYINARRIEKINYYLNCVKKNSNNKKYFYGWIKRTMSE